MNFLPFPFNSNDNTVPLHAISIRQNFNLVYSAQNIDIPIFAYNGET